MTAKGWGLLLLLLGACTRAESSNIGFTRVPEPPAPVPLEPRPEQEKEVPPDVVERAALPVSGLRAKDQAPLTATELYDALSRYDAVCIGENHDDPHHHFAELVLLEELARRASHAGKELGVGFEMFQAAFQGYLDAYARGKATEAELLERTEYEERWGFPFAYYRPLLEFGRSHGLALLALNARRELTREVARSGLDDLPPALKKELPELDLESEPHRALFDELMAGHPNGHSSLENLYAAQVIWDETMATHASQFLVARRPARKLLIVAGLAHCTRAAVVERIEHRTGLRVAAVLPSVGKPKDLSNFDYALILGPTTND